MILLASPEAARSTWVGRECEYWTRSGRRGNLLLALTDGDIVWDPQRGDFDWDATTALPPSLRGVFTEEPLYIDLRWARSDEQPRWPHRCTARARTSSSARTSATTAAPFAWLARRLRPLPC